jgi:secreted trypsin-like serine protease
MTRVHVLLSSLLTALGVWCQLPAAAMAEDTEMIVNGTEAPEGKYPWQVRLYSSMEDQGGFCGGSIIADQWILTAGHCATNGDHNAGPTTAKNPADIVVGYGSLDRTKTIKIPAAKVIVRQDFLDKGLNGKGDVALIKLKTPISHAPAVPLADPDLDRKVAAPGKKVTVTGWGAVWDSEDKDVNALVAELGSKAEMVEKLNLPIKLREVELDVIDPEVCRASLSPLTVGDTEICIMRPGTPKGSCFGDSGGPLVAPADNARGFVQVGVVSWGVRCGRDGQPNVHARVSSFTNWIRDTMKNN